MANIFADLATGATAGVFSGIGGLFKDIRSALGKVDPDKAAEVEEKLADLENALMVAQTQINLEDAKSSKWWQAGWRPGVAWVCVLTMAWVYLVHPIMDYVILLVGWSVPAMPTLSFSDLMPVLMALLGFGTLRSFDKAKGTSG